MSKLFETPREILESMLVDAGFNVRQASKYSKTESLTLHSVVDLVEYMKQVADPNIDVVLGDVEQMENVYSFLTRSRVVTVNISFCEKVDDETKTVA